MLKHILVVIALFAVTLNTFAQKTAKEKVTGTVTTADGQPTEYVCILLKDTYFGAVTNENGYFEFEAAPGNYTMVLTGMSIEEKQLPVTIKAGENKFSNLTVVEDKQELEEFVVTGQFSPQSLRNSLYKVKVINNKSIEQKGATDIQSLLNSEVGIRISNDMSLGESNFELMGMSGNNVKILLDGVPLVDRGSTKQSLSQIDLNTIEQIEIVEGPMSVIYGTDALAGVINIITKKAKVLPDRNTFSIAARVQEESVGDEYGFFSGEGIHNQSVSGMFASKTGFYVNAGFTRNEAGGWTGEKTGREKTWPPKDQYYYDGTFGFRKKNLNVWYRLNYLDETIYTPLNGSVITPNEVTDKDYLVDRYTHSLQADWQISNKVGLNIASSFQGYKRKTRTIIKDLETGEKWLSTEESSQDVSKYQMAFVRATAAWIVNPLLSFQPGVEYNWDKGSGGRIDGEPDISSLAAFLSAEWKPWYWLNLRPGLRTIITADYDAPLAIPSLSTKFSLTKKMDLRLAYAYGFRAPTLQELYFSFHNANHNIDGNPDLKAEYSNSFIGSFTWHIVQNKQLRVTSSLSGFYNDFRDRITTATDVNDNTHVTYYNVDDYKTTGGTLENSLIWKTFQASVGLSLVGRYNSFVNNDDFKGEDLPEFRFSPEVTANVSYLITKTKTTLNFYYKYTGERKEYYYDSTNKELYLGGLNGYHTADFTVGQTIGKYLTLNAGVKNLFDVTTVDNSSGGTGHSSTGSSSLMGCGRSYFVGLNFLFNN